jgi:hypothetical protein
MIGETILHYKIIEKLGEPACRKAGWDGSALYLGVSYDR